MAAGVRPVHPRSALVAAGIPSTVRTVTGGALPSVMRWWERRPEMFRDAVGALPIVLVFVLAQQIYGGGGPFARAAAVVTVMLGALTVRRRWPVVSFGAALLTVMIALTGMEFLAVASYTLVAYRPRAHPAIVAGVAAVAVTIGHLRWWPTLLVADIAGDVILIIGVSVLPVVLGVAVRRARRTRQELEHRNAELVTLRERAARYAVEAERFRIARELHDVVAHHLSAMTVRARAGRHLAARDPRAAEDALAYVAEAGTDALTAMGSFVGALRGESADGSPDLAPQPGLGDVPDLVDAFRGAGLTVHAQLDAVSADVPPALGLNAYRIVQEGLTNVIRHGAAERAWVVLRLTAGSLHIQIDDDGHGVRTDAPLRRHGLVGVAERAAVHDGTSGLSTSPHGGCRLTATLTVPERSRARPALSPGPAA